MTRRLTLLTLLASMLLASPATASPIFNLDLHHNPTHFHPGGTPVEVSVSTVTQGASPSTDEVQHITKPNSTSGNFKLKFGASTTPNLPFDATTAQVKAALEALPSIGAGNVTVSATATGSAVTWSVTFTGAFAATDVPEVVALQGTPRLAIEPEYWIDLDNVGPDPTSGTVTLTVTLPPGFTRKSVRSGDWTDEDFVSTIPWSCPGSAGQQVITCTLDKPIPRHLGTRGIKILVNVASNIPPGSVLSATAEVSGGGAPPAPSVAGCAPGIGACASEPTLVEVDPAPFGVLDESFRPDLYEADGMTPVRQAGAHPDLLTVPLDFNSVDNAGCIFGGCGSEMKLASETIRDLHVDTPPGFLGAPSAVDDCPTANLTLGNCPGTSQVGRVKVTTSPATGFLASVFTRPVFNMEHPRGALSDLAFVIAGNPVHIRAGLDPGNNYAITTVVPNINETLPPFSSALTLWGVPADPSHDSERCTITSGTAPINTDQDCPSDAPLRPFLTTPFQCGVEKGWRLHHYDSWQHPGAFGPDLTYAMPGTFSGCDQIPFDPSVSVAPSTDHADSASGLDVTIDLPQNEDCEQIAPAPPAGEPQYDCGVATSPLKDATVTLPEGITVNPASGNGLAACSPAQISLGTDDPVQCPEASRVASVQVETVLPDPVKGTVYLATPHDNPFGTLLAGYLVLADPGRGLLVKIPGRIDVDKGTGRLSGSFEENPQLPFSEFELHFKGGAHSSLITPKTCGNYTSAAEFSPWSGNPAVHLTDSFTITHGAGGGTCASSEADLPNSPSFDAGPVSPVSKNYSPFALHLRRSDGTQRFSAFNVTLPQGLTGKLAGTGLCSDGALAAAQSGSGREEQASPSCPLDSHVGEVVAGAGAGPSPYYAKGDAYLAGPYKGAPVSLAVITPAVAGPFDLGTIVIRTPLRIDSKTAQITAVSDPIPQMLQGIPTEVRSVDVIIDRPEFTLTGTSCDPASIEGLLTSTLGQSAPLSVRYQLSDCTRLPFKPKLALRLRGSTGRAGNPALTAVLTPRPGDANIASASVALPPSEFLDNSHIGTVCTRVQFAADQCPSNSIYGEATVTTPLLADPLAGHVYLRSSDNPLPDLVPDLRGPATLPIKLEAAGRTDSIRGGLRNTFDFVPDAPFTKFVLRLPGGAKGLIENSRNICARAYHAKVVYTAHNGLTYVDHPTLRAKCGGRGRKGKGRVHKRSRVVERPSAVR
jgi:hypothetical protein